MRLFIVGCVCLSALLQNALSLFAADLIYPLVDTGQAFCYDTARQIRCPSSGTPFYGQDAQHHGAAAHYRDNNDGSISDLVTGLTWSKGLWPHMVSLEEARQIAAQLELGGYSDWRVPTIKELYSLIDFRGRTGRARPDQDTTPADAIPYIDTDYFDFAYSCSGERYIDAQWLSSTVYVSTTMNGAKTLFGVNFADGRIKGYGYQHLHNSRQEKKFQVRFVRGAVYGENRFVDNRNGTVSDHATGLMWMQNDSARGMNWQDALTYSEQLNFAGYQDWRLPNAKELQSIVDYSRSPATHGAAAIDPLFKVTAITNEAGQRDYPFFWTSTTHLDGLRPGTDAVYVAFGRAIGTMHGQILDVHGAGAQRGDPKTGQPDLGHGPQGDARRIFNYVRCVRTERKTTASAGEFNSNNGYPNRIRLSQLAYRPQDSVPQQRPEPLYMNKTRQPPTTQPGFVEHLDRDGDGRVSRNEFDGPPERFDVHDSNHDGYISPAEAPQGPPPQSF